MACGQKEPLIRAAFGALIGADPQNEVSANQRFLLRGKVVHVKLNHYRTIRKLGAHCDLV